MIRVLVNCSNHPSTQWSEEQKEGWDKIIDIPFPDVAPDLSVLSSDYRNIERDTLFKILDAYHGEGVSKYLMLQGEFSLCYRLYQQILKYGDIAVVVPTTKRIVEEVIKPDGVEKKTKFKFERWRVVNPYIHQ